MTTNTIFVFAKLSDDLLLINSSLSDVSHNDAGLLIPSIRVSINDGKIYPSAILDSQLKFDEWEVVHNKTEQEILLERVKSAFSEEDILHKISEQLGL